MNTFSIAALLLPVLTSTLSAQELKLTADTTRGFEASVANASDGSLVVLVLGMQPSATRLPGGLVLGVQADALVGIAIADADGQAKLAVPMPREVEPFTCFVQAVAIHPRLPIDAPGGITLSDVQKVAVSQR